MAQFARPSTDAYNSDGWTEDDGTSVNMWDEINEVSASDTDYVRSALAPTNDVYVTKLTSVNDPALSTGHVVRWRRQAPVAGGATVNLTVQLRQGYVNESTLGTLIAEKATVAAPGSWADDSLTLSGAEADSITDYADLYLRFLANQP